MKNKKEMSLIVNDINVISFDDGKDLPGIIAELFAHKIKYASLEALQEYLIQIKEMLIEAQEEFGIKHNRTIKFIHNAIERNMDRETMTTYFYDLILRFHKESTLPGFGYIAMEKTEDGARRQLKNFRINPEKTSTTLFALLEG